MNQVYKALSDPNRRRILELLRDRDLTAGEFASHFDLAKSTLSGHFTVLKQADLIQADKKGSTITYHLNISVLEDALLLLASTFKLSIEARSPKHQPHDAGVNYETQADFYY